MTVFQDLSSLHQHSTKHLDAVVVPQYKIHVCEDFPIIKIHLHASQRDNFNGLKGKILYNLYYRTTFSKYGKDSREISVVTDSHACIWSVHWRLQLHHTSSYLGHVQFRQSYFVPQHIHWTKISVNGFGLSTCSISMDISHGKGCSKSACAIKSRVSHKASAIHWISFQFSLTCCDIQYEGVLVNFHMNTDGMRVPAQAWLYSHITACYIRICWTIYFLSQRES